MLPCCNTWTSCLVFFYFVVMWRRINFYLMFIIIISVLKTVKINLFCTLKGLQVLENHVVWLLLLDAFEQLIYSYQDCNFTYWFMLCNEPYLSNEPLMKHDAAFHCILLVQMYCVLKVSQQRSHCSVTQVHLKITRSSSIFVYCYIVTSFIAKMTPMS